MWACACVQVGVEKFSAAIVLCDERWVDLGRMSYGYVHADTKALPVDPYSPLWTVWDD